LAKVFRGSSADPATATRGGKSLLSERERQVLCLVAHGHTNQETASQLQISVKSVETYRLRVMEKLGLRSRAELVKYALTAGLLGQGDPGRPAS
jgi:two-component system response regulator NreC